MPKGSGMEGDFGKLDAWNALLDNGEAFLEATSAAMAEETIELIKQGFRDETDPYKKRWKAKKRADGRKVLSGRTSRLKGGWHRQRADEGGFVVAPSVDYAAPHQSPKTGKDGQLKRPRRMMVPASELGLPPAWARRYERTAQSAFKGFFSTSSAGGGGSFVTYAIAGVKRRLNIRSLIRRAARLAEGES
jgi:hypothetical protein